MLDQSTNRKLSANKRIAKNTVFLYIRMLVMMAISLYTSRIVLKLLGVEDYGIFNVVGGVVSLTSFLSSMMSASTQRFLNIEIGKNDSKSITKVFSTSIQIYAAICIIILLFAETLGLWFVNHKMNIPYERMSAANWVFQFSLLSSFIAILSSPYNAAIIAYEKMSAFAYISVIEVILKLIIVFLLYISPVDKLVFYSFLLFLVQLIVRIIYGNFVSKNFSDCHYRYIYDKVLLKEMLSFASWSFMGAVSGVGYTQGVSIILNLFFGVSVNAARGITTQVQSAIQGFITNFQVAVNPQLYKGYASKDFERMKELIYMSSRYSFYLMLLLALPIIFETEPILTLWLKTVPEHTTNFVRLLLLVLLIETLTNPVIVSINATGNIKKCQIIVGLLLLSILPISYISFKLNYPPETAYIIQLIIVILAQLSRLLILKPMIHLSLLDYFRKVILNIVFVLVLSIIVPFILCLTIPFSTSKVIIIIFTCIISTSFIVFYIGMNANERKSIQELLTKVLHNKNR